MKKCLKIIITVDFSPEPLMEIILKEARKLEVEGTAQVVAENEIRIMACGTKENVDEFLDLLHNSSGKYIPKDVVVEPFIKERDYRGIFRIIE